MARKRVEVTETMGDVFNTSGNESAGMQLDLGPTDLPPMHVNPNPQVPKQEVEEVYRQPIQREKQLVNCLRNERIEVKFVARETAMVHDKRHVLYGGMADTATRNFVVPRLASTGIYKNILTDDEKDYLEYVMGLEKNALSIYKKNDNFWDDSNPNGIGRVTLRKYGNYLNLNNPADYIRYKILLANKDQIAPSLEELEERPKATYQFVLVSENSETKNNLSKMEATSQCYFEFGAVKNDKDTLRVIIELIEKRPTTSDVKLDYLQNKINEYIQRDPRRFLSIITDKLLPAKVLIKRGQEAGVIGWRNNLYYLKQDNSPLCEMGEESTLTNAARYITAPKNQEIKYIIEARLKDE